jgi:hypothetical protein
VSVRKNLAEFRKLLPDRFSKNADIPVTLDGRSCYGEKTKLKKIPLSLEDSLDFFLSLYARSDYDERNFLKNFLLLSADSLFEANAHDSIIRIPKSFRDKKGD